MHGLHRVRCWIAAVLLGLLTLSGAAWGAFPATIPYNYIIQWTGQWDWDIDVACEKAVAYWNAGAGDGNSYANPRVATTVSPLPGSPPYAGIVGFCYHDHSKYGQFQQTLAANIFQNVGSPTCPANSTVSGSLCHCNAGFQQSSKNSCVVAPMPDESAEPEEGGGGPDGESCRRPIEPSPQPGLETGWPINAATGEKILREVDYEGTGPHALTFVRTFRSYRVAGPMRAEAKSALGRAWSHNHWVVLVQVGTPGTSESAAHVLFGDGSGRRFNWDTTSGTWIAANTADTLSTTATGTVLRKADDGSTYEFNQAGKLLRHVARNGWTYTYTYNTKGLLQTITNQFGKSLTLTYYSTLNEVNGGYLYSIVPSDAPVVYYGWAAASNGQHRLNGISRAGSTSGEANRYYLHEDATYPELVTGVRDENGNRITTYAYDASGRGISTRLTAVPTGYSISYGQNASAITDPLGQQRSFSYTNASGKFVVTGASMSSAASGGAIASRAQDPTGFISQETDFLGISTSFTWDPVRRLPVATTQAAGRPEERTRSVTWHPSLPLPLEIRDPGRSTTFTYDTAGNRLTETVQDLGTGQARAWSWTYNGQGLVATATEPGGGVTRFDYNGAGQLISETDPAGHLSTFTYGANGRVAQRTAPSGAVATYTYDNRGRLATESEAGLTRSFTYHPNGLLASASFPSGLVVTYAYDTSQRLTGWSTNQGSQVAFVLDALGNRTSEQIRTTGGAIVWQLARTVNSANRVVAETVGVNQSTTFGHDANGQLTSEANALSQTTHYGLDGLQRMMAITDAANAVATLAYDARDAVTTATDFKGVATTYARNAFGEASQETSPDIGSRATQFDAAGRPSQVTDALGQTTTITRDVVGRPTQLSFADGQSTVLRHDLAGADYNAPGAPNASKGRLSEVQDRSGTTRWQRDLLGRVTQKVQALANGSTQAVGYTYNAKGLLDTLTYPGGGQLKHHYTAAGQLASMDWNGVPLVTGIQWNAAGQPTGWTWAFATPVQASRSYDTAGRMTANEFASYTWDAAGRLTGISQSLARPADADPVSSSIAWGTTTFSASYDAVGRITGFGNGTASTTFSYDANANRLSSGWSEAGSTETRTYAVEATSNRLASVTQAASGPGGSASATIGYIHDANGALTFDGRNRYAYDAEGRLSSSAPATGEQAPVTRYAHNALGQRVFKTEPQYAQAQQPPGEQSLWEQFLAFFGLLWSPQTQPSEQLGWAFVYDEEGTLLSEMGMGGPSSTGATHHIWLPTPGGPMPIATIINGSKFAVHADHLNTPRRLTNESGQAVWQWAYSAFGDEEPTRAAHRFAHPTVGLTTGVSDVQYNLRLPGQYADQESGLHYNYFRTYQPRDGGFTQPDPISMRGGWNRFAYVSGDPLRYADPLGLMKLPSDPSGLPPEWTPDPRHRAPNGQRLRHPSGDFLDWNPGRSGEPGFQGKDHWHHNGGKWHYLPGDEIPDPECPPEADEPSLFERLRDALTPHRTYDPRRDEWLPGSTSSPWMPVLPGRVPVPVP